MNIFIKWGLICWLCWGLTLELLAQDSLTTKKNKTSFVFKFDNRFSFSGSQLFTIYGFRTGVKIFQKHELGIALNWISSQNILEVILPKGSDVSEPKVAEGIFFYRYAGLFYEYDFYQRNRWQMSVPLQVGGGLAGLNVIEPSTQNLLEDQRAKFVLFEPSYNVSYKIMRYFGVGSGLGYRFVLSPKKVVNENLTRPVFILKVKLYLGEIYRGIIGKKSS
jgi:hypothetical protein